MKKVAIVIMAMVFIALYIAVEATTNMTDPIRNEVYLVARTEGYNYAGVRHLSRKDDGSKLDELLREITEDAECEEGDDHIYVRFLEHDLGDSVTLIRVTKGFRNLGVPEKAYVFALVFDD